MVVGTQREQLPSLSLDPSVMVEQAIAAVRFLFVHTVGSTALWMAGIVAPNTQQLGSGDDILDPSRYR